MWPPSSPTATRNSEKNKSQSVARDGRAFFMSFPARNVSQNASSMQAPIRSSSAGLHHEPNRFGAVGAGRTRTRKPPKLSMRGVFSARACLSCTTVPVLGIRTPASPTFFPAARKECRPRKGRRHGHSGRKDETRSLRSLKQSSLPRGIEPQSFPFGSASVGAGG